MTKSTYIYGSTHEVDRSVAAAAKLRKDADNSSRSRPNKQRRRLLYNKHTYTHSTHRASIYFYTFKRKRMFFVKLVRHVIKS